MLKRTEYCGRLRTDHIGQTVVLNGWVNSYRDHGGLVFVDLRDREGLVQLVFDPESHPDVHKIARAVRCEWVIGAKGLVRPRGEGLENPRLATGKVEVLVEAVEILLPMLAEKGYQLVTVSELLMLSERGIVYGERYDHQ